MMNKEATTLRMTKVKMGRTVWAQMRQVTNKQRMILQKMKNQLRALEEVKKMKILVKTEIKERMKKFFEMKNMRKNICRR